MCELVYEELDDIPVIYFLFPFSFFLFPLTIGLGSQLDITTRLESKKMACS
jgi:hypothetical protein